MAILETYMNIHGKVTTYDRLLYTFPTRRLCPMGRRKRLHVFRKRNQRENLKQADEKVRYFVVRKLLNVSECKRNLEMRYLPVDPSRFLGRR